MDEEEFEKELTRGNNAKHRTGEESSAESDDEDVQRKSAESQVQSHQEKQEESQEGSESDSQSAKSGPLPNKLQEEAACLHDNYLVKLESLAAEYKVDVRRVKRYLALDVAVHCKPNRYNVFLHARLVDDPLKNNGKTLQTPYIT